MNLLHKCYTTLWHRSHTLCETLARLCIYKYTVYDSKVYVSATFALAFPFGLSLVWLEQGWTSYSFRLISNRSPKGELTCHGMALLLHSAHEYAIVELNSPNLARALFSFNATRQWCFLIARHAKAPTSNLEPDDSKR
jgi:hypothetical protein